MPDFRRGAEAIAQAKKKATAGGNFTPFAPEIFWKDDGDSRYLLFLTPVNEVPTVDMINMIPVKKKKANDETFTSYERVIARTDSSVGEDVDPIHKEWDYRIQDMCVAAAVELEVETEEDEKGRKRPIGFAIKTYSYDRRIRDEDTNELTDDTEEVTAPAVGLITQSPHNFFNIVTSFDSETADIESTPVKIIKVGSGTDTTFRIEGYEQMDVDLGPLLDYIDGVSYIPADDMKALVEFVDSTDDDHEAALAIGDILLTRRLEELHDSDRYDRIHGQITEVSKYPASKKGKGKGKKSESKPRPVRQSQRRSRQTEGEPEGGSSDNAVAAEAQAEPEPTPEPEAKPAPRQRRQRKAKPKETEAEPTSQKDPAKMSQLDRLRQRAEEAKEKATA